MLLLEAADALQNPVAALHPALDGEALVQLRQPRLEALALKSRDGVLLELPALAGDAELRLRPVLLQKPRLRIEAALAAGCRDRIFDAYVNVGSISRRCQKLAMLYPESRVIIGSKGHWTVAAGEDWFEAEGIASHRMRRCPWRSL